MQLNVTHNERLQYKGNTPIKLNNGDILELRVNKAETNYYLVSTYGDNRPDYCSLIDLQNGARKFTEPCSRKTTVYRVLAHFGLGFAEMYQAISQYKVDEYVMNIDLQSNGRLV